MVAAQVTADAVVIGGGVMGCSIAYQLAKRGFGKIILCERDGIASGSTGGSSALIRMHYSDGLAVSVGVRGIRGVFRGRRGGFHANRIFGDGE